MKPYFEISKKVVLEKYHELENLADVISYSSKTNPLVTEILEINTDCMFSVHFINELKNIKDKSRIMFLAQAWTAEVIKSLLDQGITWFIIDNESDLDIFIDFLKENDVKINLLLRLKLKENTIRTEKHFVFGMYSEIVNKRIKELSENKDVREKIVHLGVHFHRKTQNLAEWNLVYELENNLTEETINCINIVNIGGGIPSEYANTNIKVLDSIKKKIIELKVFLNAHHVKMVVEPGRAISAPAARLITEIIGIYENNVIVNASVYNTDLDALIVPVKLKVKDEYTKERAEKDKSIVAYTIKGTTPCSMDLFRYRVYLKPLNVGDRIIFLNAGAYNFASDFCDLEKLEIVVLEDFEND
jgi:ornithine decarboxylase